MYERLKERMIEGSAGGELTAAGALAAGASAGTLAALATTPLDVVKTRQQVGAHPPPRLGSQPPPQKLRRI